MFIDTCHYFKWVGGYFLQTSLEKIYVHHNILRNARGTMDSFGIAVSISTILKIAFLKMKFLKLLLFIIAKAFGKIC